MDSAAPSLLLLLLASSVTGLEDSTPSPAPATGPARRAPRITEHPVSAVVPRHDPVTLSCKAEGRPQPSVSWTRNGEPLSASNAQHRLPLPGGSLFFLRVDPTDAGSYRCVATNNAGKAVSKEATLDVAVLKHDFRHLPADAVVSVGETALLQCSPPRGRPDPAVFWRKDGRKIDPLADRRVRLVDGSNLAIESTRPSDSGRYQCVAQNAAGVRETPDVLVQVAAPPTLQKGPKDTTALVGSDVVFPCSVSGDPPPDVLWRRNGEPMPLGRVHVLPDRSLRLAGVQLADAGQYICEADNKAGALSAAATLVVISMPVLTPAPASLVTVEEQGSAEMECGAHGSPTPAVFWALQGNRTLLVSGEQSGRFSVEKSQQGSAVLRIQNVTRADSGLVVSCFAVNAAGSLVSRSRLLVIGSEELPPPVIERGPANATLPQHSAATLPCKAVGQGQDVTIAWYKGGGIVVEQPPRVVMDAAGSLHITSLEAADSGRYECVAASRSGKSAWSAWLLVSDAQKENKAEGDPPGRPSRPHIIGSSNTSVTLTWRRNNNGGSSPLLGYQVEMYGPEQGDWRVVAHRVSSSTYTQRQLSPGVAYTFLVRAENSHGLSPPSELTPPIVLPLRGPEAELEEDGAVEDGPVIRLTQVVPVSPTSVKLLWEVLDPDQVNGLSIYWRSVGEESLHTLAVLQSGPPSLGFLVTGLRCFTRYQFFLVPFNHAGEGRPSNMQEVRTLADAPNAPPTQLEAKFLNSSTVYITWSPPPSATHNGEIESYEVVVKGGDPPELLSNVTLTADFTGSQQLLLSNLSQQVAYHVVVAAATSAGRGPFSPPLTFRPPNGINIRHTTRPDVFDDTTNHHVVQGDPGVSPGDSGGDLVTETWFMALLGSMVAVMVILFSAILFLHRRQHRAKKSGYPHLQIYDSRSNGGVLSLKAAEAEAEVEGAPLCIAPRPGSRMMWGTNSSLGAGGGSQSTGPIRFQDHLALPEYAEARPLRSECEGSAGASEYAEVKSKYALLSTFQGQGRRGPSRSQSASSGCSCECESASQCCSASGSDGSTVAYATTTLVGVGSPAPPCLVSSPASMPFPTMQGWNRSCEPMSLTPQIRRSGTGHYSDTYQQNEKAKKVVQKRTAITLNFKSQSRQKNYSPGQAYGKPQLDPLPPQLQSGLAFLRTPQYNDYPFCTSATARD